jgi:Protein of unknown function (DUF2877)
MQSINTLSLAPDGNDWLANSCRPRILHVFDRACNLINERREVLSIVTPQIGNGPFNLVVEDEVLFPDHLTLESPIFVSANRIILGNLNLRTADTKLWSPLPDWEVLHTKKVELISQLTSLAIATCRPSLPISLLSTFSTSIANADSESCPAAARRLAGLGIGLTPAGDDFILGAVLAAWIIHPVEIASVLAKEVTNTAAPLTTSLSAAWLRSAGKGEAGILWHELFDALISSNPVQIQTARDKVLATGETSGADALAGFSGVFACLRKSVTSEIH